MARVAKLFELHREGLNVQRRLMCGRSAVPGIILAALDKQHYVLSAALGGCVGLAMRAKSSGPGTADGRGRDGRCAARAVGFGIGAGAWEIVALTAFVVTCWPDSRCAWEAT